MWLLLVVLAFAFMVGSAMILLHTAKIPKLPSNKPKDEEESK